MTPADAVEAVHDTRAALDHLAARWLVRLLGAIAALLAGAALVQELAGLGNPVSRGRAVLALLLGATAFGAALLRRRGRPTAGSAVGLAVVVLVAGVNAAATGLGLRSVLLAGAVLAIALAPLVGGLRLAHGLAALHGGSVLLLYLSGHDGALAVPGQPPPLGAHLLLLLVGLLVAHALRTLFDASIGRALAGEERLDELLHSGHDWVWELDAKGRLCHLSDRFEERTGQPREAFLRLGEPGGAQPVVDDGWRQWQEIVRQPRPFRDLMLVYQCPDGTLIACSSSGGPLRDAAGRVTGWRGTGRNVTAQWQAQQALQRSREMVDRLVSLSPDPIAVGRLRGGRIVLANPAFVALSGRPREEVLGRSALELGLWRDVAEAERLGALLAADGQVRDMPSEGWIGGERRTMMLTAAAFEAEGEPLAMFTVRDVTDVERARRQADAILDHTSVGIAFVRGARFERANPAFEAMFGFGHGALNGRPTAAAWPDGHDDVFARGAGGEPVDLERTLQRADGRRLLLHLRAAPIDAAQPALGTIWVAEDVTERRRAETELAQAKHEAEAASEAKSAFLAAMSHEIRTPLNGVLGLARLLNDDTLDATRRREYVSHLVEAAEHLTGIVSDVLDLSKIEAGQLEIEDTVFDLPRLVHGTFRTFAPLGRERGLAMHCRLDPRVPRQVRGDPLRVRQIVANYLANALKFTERGQIVLTLAPAGGERVRVAVRDSGLGVTPAARERLFKPFSQGDSSTTRRFGGTGLGLSICRTLAERMGGSVGVDSDGHDGSTFWAELRLPADETAPAPLDAPVPAQRPLADCLLLVAEDNPVNMLIVSSMLRRLGADIVEAVDGEEAVRLALQRAGELSAVLMDLHMPRLDGLAATRRLRADPRTAALPIVALTAAVLEHERREASEAGMNGFVPKPVVEAELLRALAPAVQAAAAR
jgi:PAS domain S-box-containing protein